MKIAVLVSGGVDSSVALQLLKNEGKHSLTAFYLKIWLEDELSYLGECPWQEDLEYARKVCEQLDVPLKIISLQKEYHEQVVSYTVNEVKQGRTPNPDILCNSLVKFGAFYDLIGHEFDKIATGHYACVREEDGEIILEITPDVVKDQTYFLARLSYDQLSRAIFPLGNYTKAQVREIAEKYDLPTKKRKDSQGLCFLGKIKFKDFIKHHVGEQEGQLIEYETGKVLGVHQGFWFYTLGQRQGLGLSHGPWYVVEKDSKNNKVFISSDYNSLDKKRDVFFVEYVRWFAGTFPEKKNILVKVRHGEIFYSCTWALESGKMKVILSERDQGIAPGQFAVFYDGNRCLGSGIISE